MRTDPNMRTGMSITGNENLRVLVPTYIKIKSVSLSVVVVVGSGGGSIEFPRVVSK
jgi:hypothetical protein